jgi:hypothetical protein
MKRTAPVLGALAVAALISLALVHRVHLDAPSEFGLESGDLIHYHYPTAQFLHAELQQGNLPLWNPYQFAGQPFLALHTSCALYPPHLLFLMLFEPAQALEFHFAFHLWIAGWFTWLLAGRLGLGTAARSVAAVGYMFSGPLLFGFYMPVYLGTQAWFPCILWALHGLASDPRVRWCLALGVALALAFLGGLAQAFLFELQLAACYGIWVWITLAPREQRGRVVLLAGLAGLLALGWIAPQLLSTIELAGQTVRSGHTPEEASAFSLSAMRLLRGLFGMPDHQPYPFYSGSLGPLAWYGVLPMLGAPLIACGVWARQQRGHVVFFAAAAVFCGLFVLGPQTPLFGWYYQLPFGDLFRGPTRLTFLYGFTTAMAVAIGLQGAVDRLARRGAARFAGATGLVLALVIAGDHYRRTEFVAVHPVMPSYASTHPETLVARLREDPARPRLFVQNPTRLPDRALSNKIGMTHGVFAMPDYEPLLPSVYARYFEPPETPPWHGDLSVLAPRNSQAESVRMRLLDAMSVGVYAAPPGLPEAWFRRLEALAGGPTGQGDGVRWADRPKAAPRAYTVSTLQVAADLESARDRVAARDFDLRREAVVFGEGARAWVGAETRRAAEPASIVEYETDRVAVRVRCQDDCLLVLTDLAYPGWTATADGQARPLLTANALFRGVQLSAGEHLVEFGFAPRSLEIGIIAFAVATGVALLLVIAPRFRPQTESR